MGVDSGAGGTVVLDPGDVGWSEVQAVLENNCVSCHGSDGPGRNSLALNTVGDAAAHADIISLVTQARVMPPWLASDLSIPFKHDWTLSEEEIALIAAWADSGGEVDVAADTPLVARRQTQITIEPDQVIDPTGGPYSSYVNDDRSPLRRDDYRCRVYQIDDPEGDGTWVKGFEFRPDNTEVTHHAIVVQVPASDLDEIERRIAADNAVEQENGWPDQPGWTCFSLAEAGSTDGTFIQGWAPGRPAEIYPEGYGLYFDPGDMLVVQTHYHYDYATAPDSSQIVLQHATDAEVAGGLSELNGWSYLAPVEVPCTAAEEALAAERAAADGNYVNFCDRENVLWDLVDKYGTQSGFIPDYLIKSCGGSVSDYSQLDGTIGHSSCDHEVVYPGTIHGLHAHMHELGAAYRMTLHPDTANEVVLLDIPRWDFEWQLSYQPVDAVEIAEGDMLRFECWWDRGLQDTAEPRYVTWGDGTVDEMCFSTITVIPT